MIQLYGNWRRMQARSSYSAEGSTLRQETVEICDYFNISPYQLMSAGAVLLTATHGQKVLAELAAAGIPAVIIGHLTDDNDRVVLNDEEMRFLEPFRYESLNQARSES